MRKNKSRDSKLLKIRLVLLGVFFLILCFIIAASVRLLLFDTLKVTTSVAEYDIFIAPPVEETLKFTFIFALILSSLKTTRSMETSIELTDALLFSAFGIGYGLVEKFVPLLSSNIQISLGIILFKIMPSTSLHFATSLIHSYNAFRLLVLRKSLTLSVVLFFSAIALHTLFNLAMIYLN